MRKTHWIILALLVVTLTLVLSGCGTDAADLEGKYVATFDLNGGKLNTRTSEVTTQINYAYAPDALILDPTENADKKLGYEVSRAGYIFTGWYTSKDCLPEQKWDFSTGKITEEKVTLYAGWQKKIVYTYSVCYMNGTETVTLGSYSVEPGAKFSDYLKYSNKRSGYTSFGYYTDADCTTPWDENTVHPGGETDKDVQVFVRYIEGTWTIVDSYEKLLNSIGKGNIYLMADIDCGGRELSLGTLSGTFEGNGHTISNFTVAKVGGLRPSISLFQMLSENSKLQNVNFENVTYQFTGVSSAKGVKVAAIAEYAKNCTVSNVNVSGTFVTDYVGTADKVLTEEMVNAPFSGEMENIHVENCNVDIEFIVETQS